MRKLGSTDIWEGRLLKKTDSTRYSKFESASMRGSHLGWTFLSVSLSKNAAKICRRCPELEVSRLHTVAA